MSDEIDPKHYYYVGANNAEWEQKKAKMGHSKDVYGRMSGYGSAYYPDDPFRFRLVIEVYKPPTEPRITEIEGSWIGKFQQIDRLQGDENNLNVASSIEAVRFTDQADFKMRFHKVLTDKGLFGLFIRAYETDAEINELLRHHKIKYHCPKPLVSSLCGAVLRPYQEDDINLTLYHFLVEKYLRAYWSIMCGLGKTLMAYELILRIKSQGTFFVVSRNTLLEQALSDFLALGCPPVNLFIYSANKMPPHLQHIKKIRSYTELPTDRPWICIILYGNLPNFKGATGDLAIFDEAHHLVPSGMKENMLAKDAAIGDLSGNQFGLSDKNIRVKWRLALTATPKDTPCVENKKIHRIGFTYLENLFGKCIAQRNYVFGRDNGFLAPFEVVSIKATAEKIKDVIKKLRSAFQLKDTTFKGFLEEFGDWVDGKRKKLRALKHLKPKQEVEKLASVDIIHPVTEDEEVEEEEDEDEDEEDTSNITDEQILWYAVIAWLTIESIQRYDRKRIVTCHNNVKKARLFKRIFDALWSMNELSATKTMRCDAIHSKQKSEENQAIKARFKAKEGADIRILCNIRTLMEGFDHHAIDGVVFVDNKWSPIECIQFIGRGTRIDPANPTKKTTVLIPFITQEIQQDEDLSILKTTSDYQNVRYCIKHIIESLDPNQSVTSTVWVPKPRDPSSQPDKDDFEKETDQTEKVFIPDELMIDHDANILGVCATKDLAGKSFDEARLWMHELAHRLGWQHFMTEQKSKSAWDDYRNTHILPKGIPYDPARVYKEVGYINWRDYAGVLLEDSEILELSAGEMLTLIKQGLNPLDHTMATLKKAVWELSSRRLPDNPRDKWKKSIYDLMDIITPGSASVVRKWGRHTDDLYLRLQSLNISDSIVFENQWTKLHQHNPSIPGIPTELFGSDFWNNYDPAV
jgi:superfamily II DNA or RNA helicase